MTQSINNSTQKTHTYRYGTGNKDIYNLILKKIGKPKLTVILYATPESILSRLKNRDINDSDISKVSLSEKAYERMIYFCETKKLEYLVIDTSNKTPNEVVDEILKRIEMIDANECR